MTDHAHLDCPVCPARGIESGQLECPNCGTDLGSLWRLREMAALACNQALTLFQAGDAEAALDRLREGGRQETSGAGGVLAGKILWKLGRKKEAAREWALVPIETPQGPKAKKLLAEAQARLGKERRRLVAVVVVATMALLATPSFIIWLVRDDSPARALPKVERAVSDDVDSAGPPSVAETGADAPLSSSTSPPPLPAALVDALRELPGFEADVSDQTIRIVPHEGLFAGGANEVSAAGRTALSSVASVLASAGVPLSVEVVGWTDTIQPGPSSPWEDNWTLAMGRASTALHFLRGEAAAPEITWKATAPSTSPTPYPNTTPEDRARNRTVILAISTSR